MDNTRLFEREYLLPVYERGTFQPEIVVISRLNITTGIMAWEGELTFPVRNFLSLAREIEILSCSQIGFTTEGRKMRKTISDFIRSSLENHIEFFMGPT